MQDFHLILSAGAWRGLETNGLGEAYLVQIKLDIQFQRNILQCVLQDFPPSGWLKAVVFLIIIEIDFSLYVGTIDSLKIL